MDQRWEGCVRMANGIYSFCLHYEHDAENHTYVRENTNMEFQNQLSLFQGIVLDSDEDTLTIHPDLAKDIPGFYLKVYKE